MQSPPLIKLVYFMVKQPQANNEWFFSWPVCWHSPLQYCGFCYWALSRSLRQIVIWLYEIQQSVPPAPLGGCLVCTFWEWSPAPGLCACVLAYRRCLSSLVISHPLPRCSFLLLCFDSSAFVSSSKCAVEDLVIHECSLWGMKIFKKL